VTPRQAAEAYGMTVTRSGMTRCPFHTDASPSMKLYDNAYHCFGCQAHGDVIALTAGLHGTGMREAAERLAADFGIPVTAGTYTAHDRRQRETVLERERRETELENRCFVALADYLHILRDWRERYRPSGEDNAPPHLRFAEACRMYTAVEYMVDTLTTGEKTARRALIAEIGRRIGELEDYVAEISAGSADHGTWKEERKDYK